MNTQEQIIKLKNKISDIRSYISICSEDHKGCYLEISRLEKQIKELEQKEAVDKDSASDRI